VERRGVFVMQAQGLAVEEMRAFSIGEFPLPVIVLNSRDRAYGRVFSLFHELVHISLKQSGICKWSDTEKLHREDRAVEAFCNHVAGAILVPKRVLLSSSVVKSKGSRQEWSDEELRSLSRAFSVSREVVIRRLLLCGRTSREFYEKKRGEFLKEYEKLRSSQATPIVRYSSRVVNRLGRGYIELVLDSYYERRVSLNAVSDYLGVRIKHIPDIEVEVMTVRRRTGGAA